MYTLRSLVGRVVPAITSNYLVGIIDQESEQSNQTSHNTVLCLGVGR